MLSRVVAKFGQRKPAIPCTLSHLFPEGGLGGVAQTSFTDIYEEEINIRHQAPQKQKLVLRGAAQYPAPHRIELGPNTYFLPY